jgi:hypothetical protein
VCAFLPSVPLCRVDLCALPYHGGLSDVKQTKWDNVLRWEEAERAQSRILAGPLQTAWGLLFE